MECFSKFATSGTEQPAINNTQTSKIDFFLMLTLAVVFFYAFPLVPSSAGFINFRQIPFLKIFLITLVWSLTTVILPVINIQHEVITKEVMLIFIKRLIFIFAITLPFDIRDMSYDSAAGIKTIPLWLGIKNTKTLAVILLADFVGILIYQYIFLTVNEKIFVPLFISVLISSCVILSTNEKRSEYFFLFLVDGMLVLQFLLLQIF